MKRDSVDTDLLRAIVEGRAVIRQALIVLAAREQTPAERERIQRGLAAAADLMTRALKGRRRRGERCEADPRGV